MKIFKKLTALLLCLLLVSLCACGKGDKNTTPQNNTDETDNNSLGPAIQLLYCENDTLNPYNTKNKSNEELSTLLFDPLVTVGDDFKPIYKIAESVSIEGTACTVGIRNALFSDNTPITAEDVLNSYNLAKNSPLYSYLFYNVSDVRVTDSKTLTFTLKNHDPFFENMLTFPILKKGTENLKNEDNVEIVPIGSGRYVFSDEGPSLIANPNYHQNVISQKISLVNAPDTESLEHYVEIGATDFYTTDPVNGNITRMSGKKRSLNTTHLVFVGINHSYGVLQRPELRQAISAAIDRTAISKLAFYDYAVVANGFFHPDFEATDGYQTIQPTFDTKISIENLSKIGYNISDTDGFCKNSKGSTLTLSILVNSDNTARVTAANLIKEQLAAVGIKASVNALSNEKYFSALENGHFQLYIGEVRLTQNMDIGPLVLPKGSAAWGISQPQNDEQDENSPKNEYVEVISGYYSGQNSISEVATALINNMPVIPLLYRDNLLFYSDTVSFLNEASVGDIFLSLTKIKEALK